MLGRPVNGEVCRRIEEAFQIEQGRGVGAGRTRVPILERWERAKLRAAHQPREFEWVASLLSAIIYGVVGGSV